MILRLAQEIAFRRRDPARLGEDRPDLARGEPAQQVEPGEVGLLIQAGVQAGLGLQRPSELEVADGREALGPEMVRLVPQHGVEVAERLVPPAAFVPLLAGQELVEGRDRRQGVGRATLPFGARHVAQPGEAGRPPQMVGAGRGVPLDRLVQRLQALLGPRHRLGQDEQQDVAALRHFRLLLRRERGGQRPRCPGAVRTRLGEHFQRGLGRLAGRLQVSG